MPLACGQAVTLGSRKQAFPPDSGHSTAGDLGDMPAEVAEVYTLEAAEHTVDEPAAVVGEVARTLQEREVEVDDADRAAGGTETGRQDVRSEARKYEEFVDWADIHQRDLVGCLSPACTASAQTGTGSAYEAERLVEAPPETSLV